MSASRLPAHGPVTEEFPGKVFEQSPVAMALNDMDGRFVAVNARALTLFELTRADVVGRTSVEIGLLRVDPAEQAAFADRVRNAGSLAGEERTIHLPSGRERQLLLTVELMDLGAQRLFLSTFVDVTEQRRAEQAQRQSEARLEEAQALAHIGSWEWDLLTDSVTRSPELCRIFGMTPEQFGRSPASSYELVHPDDRERLRAEIQRARRDGGPWEIEYRIVRPDGTRYLHTRGQMVRDAHGKVVRSFGTAQDITERRLAEAQLAHTDRLVALATLAAAAAHEINNPLTSVTANLALLDQELAGPAGAALEPRRRELAAMIDEARRGAQRVGQIVDDLAVFSRAEGDRRRPVDAGHVLELAIEAARRRVRGLSLERDGGLLPRVEADEASLYRLFLNLLVNAIEAAAAGPPDAQRIGVVTRTDPRGWALIEVTDSGRGIAPELLGRIFDPFFSTKDLASGLGLAVCQQIVTRLGGELTANSIPGQGSRFRVALPPAPAIEPETATTISPGRSARVMVVDDEAQVRTVVARVLRDHQVTLVGSGVEALARITSGEVFDAILCDVTMPQMTGIELHRRLSESHPLMAARMIFMTGGTFDAAQEDYLERMANLRADKPFEPDQLRALIGQALSRS